MHPPRNLTRPKPLVWVSFLLNQTALPLSTAGIILSTLQRSENLHRNIPKLPEQPKMYQRRKGGCLLLYCYGASRFDGDQIINAPSATECKPVVILRSLIAVLDILQVNEFGAVDDA